MAIPGYLGKYDTEGGLEHEPEVSVLTQKPLTSGSVLIRFGKSPYFVEVNASEWARVTPEERLALKAKWASELPQSQASAPESAPASYEDMGLDALRKLAQDRGVDTTGKRSIQALAQALRAADVEARFAQEAEQEQEPAGEVNDGS